MAEAPQAPRPVDPLLDVAHLHVSPADVMASGVRTEPMRWCIARTGVMAERKVLTALRERRIAAYMPMNRFYRRPRGVKIETMRPLLVGYIFIGLAPHQAVYDLTQVDGIEGVLQTDGRTAIISPWSVVQIAAMEAAGIFDHTTSKRPAYCKDQLVRAVTGWATGHSARVVEIADGKLMVRFEGVFRAEPIPMSADHFEPVDESEAA
ncbi:hypothetical protein E4M02_02515 [Brevundimonas sp. S30B]|uniref:transcription termination/antitermination NusG family protein n=1 Tax=unclassified Brevundimonas TaxID=2622653 RepID=UPI001071B784|nr:MULTISPECIES: transcription termination/antitermination NusG family protein [unclassified Brevundimonas]TFW03971.1 hypothetical protein E4M02_02515 [Brevundimonas sp. S30B]